MLHNYLSLALRNLRKNKIFSFLNIAGLTLGPIGAYIILIFCIMRRSGIGDTFQMMKKITNISCAIAWALLIPSILCAQKAPYSSRFKGIKSIYFGVYHGDLKVIGHNSDTVEISGISQSPEEMPVTKVSGKKLVFSENSKVDGSSPDWPVWTLKVPQHTDFDINISGGNVSIEYITGDINCHLGAGDIKLDQIDGAVEITAGTADIDLTRSKGKFEGNTGTGDVNLDEVRGTFSFNSGTGKVKVINSVVMGTSQFNSGTGDLFFGGKGGVQADLSMNSGTDNALIELDKLNFEGTLQLKCSKSGGHIKAPFSFDEEKEERHGKDTNLVKTKKFGNKKVVVTVATGLGTASAR